MEYIVIANGDIEGPETLSTDDPYEEAYRDEQILELDTRIEYGLPVEED